MAYLPPVLKNESGFVLVASLLTLGLLVIVGISATTTTNVEIQIAGNEKAYNMVFYEADGGNEVAAEILEQNIACPVGFSTNIIENAKLAEKKEAPIWDFWFNPREWDDTDGKVYKPLTLTKDERETLELVNRLSEIPDVFIPATVDPDNPAATVPRTMISFGGQTKLASGGAIQMAAGYERVGKAAGSHGAYMEFDVTARHIGQGNSESTVHQQWRHVLGMEGDCYY